MHIDWLTFAAQVVNFLILVAVLKRFLYRPLLNAMERREKAFVDRQAELDRKIRETDETTKRLATQEADMVADRAARLQRLADEVEAQRQQYQAEARRSVDAEARHWRQGLEKERAAWLESVRHEVLDGVVSVTRKVVSDIASVDLEAALVSRFMVRLNTLSPSEQDTLRTRREPATVHLSQGLPPALQERVAAELRRLCPEVPAVTFATDLDGLGVEVTWPSYRVGWTADGDIHEVVSAVEQLLNGVTHVPASDALQQVLAGQLDPFEASEQGSVLAVSEGVAWVQGLEGVSSEELVSFEGERLGMAFTLEPDRIGVILLDDATCIGAGGRVRRTGRVLDVPVGAGLLGRVVDAVGRPLDALGPVEATMRRRIEVPAPGIIQRAPVTVPLQTGIKVVDAAIPIGRGQRELILGDRQTGKTTLAIDTILNQRDQNVRCIYCAIGQRGSAVARVLETLRQHDAMRYTIAVVAEPEDPPGLQFVAPFAATAMAEEFMQQGQDVLVVYDDLTRHAQAYRTLSLLLRRPPGREAFPGDIFYLHSRLLERATHLLAGGSLTTLPIVETEAQNLAAYIPTNLISITDGQIVLSPELFRKGILPAVDIGVSVSRIGGDAQLAAYRKVAGELKLSYAAFTELEAFSRFDTRLSDETRRILTRGRRVREVLKQPAGCPLPVGQQVGLLLATNAGLFDTVSEAAMAAAVAAVCAALPTEQCSRIAAGEKLSDADSEALLASARGVIHGDA